MKYKIKDVAIECDEKTGICHIMTDDEHIVEECPMAAWNMFWNRAESRMLKEFCGKLEENGVNLI